MLVLPKPDGFTAEEWEKAELEAMKEIIGLYGKTWHFWQVDLNHELPLGRRVQSLISFDRDVRWLTKVVGYPKLMGSLTSKDQVDFQAVLAERNRRHDVDHVQKARARQDLVAPGIHQSKLTCHSVFGVCCCLVCS